MRKASLLSLLAPVAMCSCSVLFPRTARVLEETPVEVIEAMWKIVEAGAWDIVGWFEKLIDLAF